mgnify:CR=1 FL=1
MEQQEYNYLAEDSDGGAISEKPPQENPKRVPGL